MPRHSDPDLSGEESHDVKDNYAGTSVETPLVLAGLLKPHTMHYSGIIYYWGTTSGVMVSKVAGVACKGMRSCVSIYGYEPLKWGLR